jgi:hypothetical protein
MTLKAEDGYQWSGTTAWVKNEYPDPDAHGFFDFVGIHKETTPGKRMSTLILMFLASSTSWGFIRRQHQVTILCIPF